MSETNPFDSKDIKEDGVAAGTDAADAADNGSAPEVPPQTQVASQWYGVSYYNHDSSAVMPLERKDAKRITRRSRVAFVALLVAVAVLFAALAGLGGYVIADYLAAQEENNPNTEQNPPSIILPSTGGGSSDQTTVFEASDAATYNYAAVTLTPKEGTALVGSPNGSAGEDATTRIAAVAAARNSVVEISTTTVSNRGQLVAGAGSGVIIHADGIIVTNHHVIDGASNIYVRLTNGNTYEAYLRGTDEAGDIAVLKITPQETLTVAKLGCSSALLYGEDVFAIGNPLGSLGGTVTEGIISALEREVTMDDGTVMTLLQTSAAINSGNSGGGLFNMAGELIGIVNAKYSATGVEGLGFAIPVDTAVISINELLDHGYIRGIPSLNVTLVDRAFNWYYSYPYVYAVGEGSPLQEGDWILEIDGTAVSSVSALKRAVRMCAVGDTVTLTVYRKNRTESVEVTLTEYVPNRSDVNFN
ncbi:MAG: trypsin-like peptidase domain-containing protein [Clostridia bacterium]|nr:trypsin-like peptidase domain-containing protein [Clostridia bacterium]